MNDIQHRATVATFWAYMQNWISRGLSLVVFIVLARLLTPIDFGVFAIATAMLSLAEVFVEQGLSHAIVQRVELDDAHNSTAFWSTLLLGIVLALLTLVISYPLAAHFGHAKIAPIMNALSPVFVLMALASIPAALLRRELQYKVLAQRAMLANTASGVTAIGLALAGAGVWTFVGQQLVYQLVGVIVLWKNETWRPRFEWSRYRFAELFGFSSKVISGKLLDFVETRVVDLMVGQFLGLIDLGYYSMAVRATQALTQLTVAPIWDAANSVFSKHQTNKILLYQAYEKMLEVAGMVAIPIFVFVLSSADTIVPVVFGTQWGKSIIALQILCFVGLIRIIVFLSGVAIQASGEPGLSTFFTLIRVIGTLGFLSFSTRFGLPGVAFALLFGQLLSTPFVMASFYRIVGFGLVGFIATLKRSLLVSFSGSLIIFFAARYVDKALYSLLLSALSFGLVYIYFFKAELSRFMKFVTN